MAPMSLAVRRSVRSTAGPLEDAVVVAGPPVLRRPLPRRPAINPVPARQFMAFPEDATSGPSFIMPEASWLASAERYDYVEAAREIFRILDNYVFSLPDPTDVITKPPAGCIGDYAHHFENGLRFPPHPKLVKIFSHFNVCLAQVTSPAMRTLISMLWVFLFKGFPLNMPVVKELIRMKRDGSSAAGSGWYSFYSLVGKQLIDPKPVVLG